MWAQAIYLIATLILTYYFRPKQEEQEPANTAKYPMATEGNPVPVAFGSPTVTGPNCVWYGDLRSSSVKDGDFEGFRYYMGCHLVLCHGGVDAIEKITIGDREAWSGSQGDGSIYLDDKDLFGGDKKEGGIKGTVDVMLGKPAQARNAYLVAQQGANTPAYRGVTSLVLNQVYFGTTAYPKPWAVKIRRTATRTDGAAMWYSAKAAVSGALNIVHMIHEAITSEEWGMGLPESVIDDASFKAAADTAHAEGMALSMLWAQKMSAENFIKQMEQYLDATVYVDPATDLYKIRLIRDDYTVSNLQLFNEDNVLDLKEFGRRTWAETVNEIVVAYTDQADGEEKSVTVHDVGNIQIQQGTVSSAKKYIGIPTLALAQRIALRDLRASSAPLASIKIDVNRQAWDKEIGEPFRFSWAKYGLSDVVFRVKDIDYGRLEDGKITIDAMEDVFSIPASGYIAEETSEWTDPVSSPAPVTIQAATEITYYEARQLVSPSEIDYLDTNSPGWTRAQLLAARPVSDAFDYELWSREGADAYQTWGTGAFCPTGELDGAITAALSGAYPLKNTIDLDIVEVGTFALLGGEICIVTAIDIPTSTVTMSRGYMDTVPADQADGTRVWFTANKATENAVRTDGDDMDLKPLTVTGKGTLAIGSATAAAIVLEDRQSKPYPPGNLKFNGTAYPGTISGELTITWSHRDRALDQLYAQTQGDIGPEAGATYNLRVYGDGDIEIVNETGLTGTSYALVESVLPLQDYILALGWPGSRFYNMSDLYSAGVIEDLANGVNRSLYGTCATSSKRLTKESQGSVHVPAVGDYIGYTDMDIFQYDKVMLHAVVEFSTDILGTRCIFQDGGSTRGVFWGIHGGNFGVWIIDGIRGVLSATVTAATYLTADTPHKLAALVKGETGRAALWIDDVKVLETNLGVWTDANGSNGTSFGGCYNHLAIDNTSAPVGGLKGYIDHLWMTGGATDDDQYQDAMNALTVLNLYDYETEVAVDNPYVRLKLDEASGVLYNSIGAYGDATPYGTITYQTSPLIPGAGTAILLGTDGYLQQHDYADFCNAAVDGFTLSIKTKVPPTGPLVVWVGINQSDSNRTNRLLLGFQNGHAFANVENQPQTEGTTLLTEGDMVHCHFTYNKNTNAWALYVNGNPEISGTRALAVSTADYFFIGMEEDTGGANGNYLNSHIDEFLLYQTELSAARIAILAEAGERLAGLNQQVRIELESDRGGVLSNQMHNITVTR